MTKRRRYPGSKPFETAQQDIFFGRNRDIADLTKLIELEQSVVLYGKSGLGKSSLIEAGIIPKIAEKEKYEIIKIRFGAYVEGQHEVAPLVQALEYLKSDTNWLDDNFNLNSKSDFDFNFDNLWHVLKRRQINKKRDGYLLIFDQFEELFTYPEAQMADFARQLAEVQYTNIPQHYHDLIDEGFDTDEHFLSDDQMRQLHRQLQVKTLMGIRSDRMSYMNQLKPYLPEVLVHTYELKALGTTQASAAVQQPARQSGDFQSAPFEYDPAALDNILNYLTKHHTQRIESFQLQIFCEHIEDLVIRHQHRRISPAAIGTQQDVEQIFEHYYRDKIADLGSHDQQLAARKLIEEGLIFEVEERRLSLYGGQITQQYHISPQLLDQLVNSRLLRAEPSMRGGYTYELSHDTLVAPVLKAKAERIAEEARQEAARIEAQRQQELAEAQAKAEAEKQRADKEKRLRVRANAITAIAGCLLLLALAAGGFAFYQKNETNEAKKEIEIKNKEIQTTNDELTKTNEQLEKTIEHVVNSSYELTVKNLELEAAKREADKAKDKAEKELKERKRLEITNLIKDANILIENNECKMAIKKLNEAQKIDATDKRIQDLRKKCNQ